MKKILSLFAAFLVIFSSFADPAVVTKKFKVANFKSIELGSAFEVHVHKGNVHAVTVTGQEKDIEDIEVSTSAGKLEIGYEFKSKSKWNWGWNNNRSKVVINITLPRLESGEFTGACKVDLVGFTNEEEMRLLFSGAAKGSAEGLRTDKLKIEYTRAKIKRIEEGDEGFALYAFNSIVFKTAKSHIVLSYKNQNYHLILYILNHHHIINYQSN